MPDGIVPVDLVLGALADVRLVHVDTQSRVGRPFDETVGKVELVGDDGHVDRERPPPTCITLAAC